MMMKRLFTFASALAVCALLGTAALGYDFWGVTLGVQTYQGSEQLAFDGVAASNLRYVVGGYKYTKVDSDWLGPFPAASPGEGFLASRRSDAQALFFKPDSDAARFMIITGAAQYGLPAPEMGTGGRLFGPGDLMIQVGEATYGIGLRLSGLAWALHPSTTNPEFLIWHNGEVDDIHARDLGTLGNVELNPRWDRVGHAALPADSEMAPAFYVSGSGTLVGSAAVSFADTGLVLSGARVFAYEVAVPWNVLGLNAASYSFTASWRPDCGNDLLKADFTAQPSVQIAPVPVPEPSAAIGTLSGIVGLIAAYRKRS